MLNKVCQAGTEAQQRTKDEVTTSSHTIGKPNVVCSQSRVSSLSDMKKVWLSDEYLKKRAASFKKNREVSSQLKNTDKFKVLLKDDS